MAAKANFVNCGKLSAAACISTRKEQHSAYFVLYSMISEEIENELEALKAIYGEDFQERPPVWKRPCFCIRVKPTTSTSGAIHVEATRK
jgi:hypothetical protein